MLLESVLLYASPVLCRVALASGTSVRWWDVVLSQASLPLVFASLVAKQHVRDAEHEHLVRHTLFALAFTLTTAASVRWEAVEGAWAAPLVCYLAAGTGALWGFVGAHLVENAYDARIKTHKGDVTILPLTLVALATFIDHVPTAAFRFTRSSIATVPVIVAWATLFFIAFHSFATRRITTLDHDDYHFHAHAAFVVAAVHLVLLETEASPTVFQFFPLAAALLCQSMPDAAERPSLRPHRRVGTVVVAGACGAAVAALVLLPHATRSRLVYASACVVGALTVPPVAGDRWVLPAVALSTVATWTLLCRVAALSTAWDVVRLAASYHVVYSLTCVLCPPHWRPSPPPRTPHFDPSDAPHAGTYCPLPYCCARPLVDAADALWSRPPPACPYVVRGVWYMDENWLPQNLVCLHAATWSDDGRTATLWDRRGLRHDATLGGLALALWSCLTVTQVTCLPDSPWIRTETWVLPWLRLRHATYWIYHTSADTAVRVVYDHHYNLVWKYHLVRVLDGHGHRMAQHGAFVASAGTRRALTLA